MKVTSASGDLQCMCLSGGSLCYERSCQAGDQRRKMKGSLCRIPAGRFKQSFVTACSARLVHKEPPNHTEEDNSKPLRFSTSRASHRRWTVEKSFGSEEQRPLWKVVPVSLFFSAVLIWAFFRKETEIDKIIYRPIEELLGDLEKPKSEDEKGK